MKAWMGRGGSSRLSGDRLLGLGTRPIGISAQAALANTWMRPTSSGKEVQL